VRFLALLGGLFLSVVVLWDAFETVVLPRTVARRLRLAGLYFRATWRAWASCARMFRSDGRRERFLAVYGPLSLLGLLAVWAIGLITGFAVLHWSAGSPLHTPNGPARFADDLYMSGTTFFTLGLGDIQPIDRIARLLTITEAGMGFALLAVVISYFPVLYQSFARREVRLTLLDAWAGSPPAAVEILQRLARARELKALDAFLRDWEHWCSEVLESHISYPVVAFFRSQHQRQSWVSALAAILDVSAIVIAGIDGVPAWQAHLTFAIARHTAVDLAQVLHIPPAAAADRLPAADLEQLRSRLESVGLRPNRTLEAAAELAKLRRSYEPYVVSLGRALMMPVPSWWRDAAMRDNWQTSSRRDEEPHL
jgi:voltage-gated potassium channel Kch